MVVSCPAWHPAIGRAQHLWLGLFLSLHRYLKLDTDYHIGLWSCGWQCWNLYVSILAAQRGCAGLAKAEELWGEPPLFVRKEPVCTYMCV